MEKSKENAKKRQSRPKVGKYADLLSVGDIGKIAGVPSNTVSRWVARHDDFPTPVSSPTAGNLYRRGAVLAWLKKTNRLE